MSASKKPVKLTRAQEHAVEAFYNRSYYTFDGVNMGRVWGPDKASVATLRALVRMGLATESNGSFFSTELGRKEAIRLIEDQQSKQRNTDEEDTV